MVLKVDEDIDNQLQHTDSNDSFKDIVNAVDEVFNEKNIKQKSRLSARNINGILQALTLNEWLENKFGFRNRVLDKLVEEKIVLVVSHNAKGRLEMIDIFEKLSGSFADKQHYEMLARAFGKR